MNMANLDQMNHSIKSSISCCEQSRSALIDLIILTAVIGACGFLMYPSATILSTKTVETVELVAQWFIVNQQFISGLMFYGLIGVTILTTSMVMLAMSSCKSPKCGQPDCRGLRKAVEFDIQIETEDCIKKSGSGLMKCGLKKGLFELPRDYYKELEEELKKLAPANGRVVLVFRGRCGCPVVRVEVPGSKRNNRRVKK